MSLILSLTISFLKHFVYMSCIRGVHYFGNVSLYIVKQVVNACEHLIERFDLGHYKSVLRKVIDELFEFGKISVSQKIPRTCRFLRA